MQRYHHHNASPSRPFLSQVVKHRCITGVQLSPLTVNQFSPIFTTLVARLINHHNNSFTSLDLWGVDVVMRYHIEVNCFCKIADFFCSGTAGLSLKLRQYNLQVLKSKEINRSPGISAHGCLARTTGFEP